MTRAAEGGWVVPDQEQGGEARKPLRTLAEKLNWLIEQAWPDRSGPVSNQDVCFLIQRASGEELSNTTIWKLRNGERTNPQMRVIQALAQTFGVEPAFFFADYDETKLGLIQEQVKLLALVREARITSAQLRAILGMDAAGRQAIAGLIGRAVSAEAGEENDAEGSQPGGSPGPG